MTSAVEWTQIEIEFWIERMRKFYWFIFGYKSHFPLLGSLVCGLAANDHIYQRWVIYAPCKFWIENWMPFFGQHTECLWIGTLSALPTHIWLIQRFQSMPKVWFDLETFDLIGKSKINSSFALFWYNFR